MTVLSDFAATKITGEQAELAEYRGKVVLVVNTASQCGLTPQYAGLEELYASYAEQGLVILGFPCDQFGHQEPGTDAEIAQFCETNYAVTFPMFTKIEVNGPGAHPLYQWLTSERPGADGPDIEWNFAKFLLGRDGAIIDRYAPPVAPLDLEADLKQELSA